MAVKRLTGKINVVDAARQRIINIFNNGLTVYMAFSGGKDSLCLAHVVLKLIQEGKINPKQLIVHFIDEEAIYSCIERTVIEWRKKFILAGARFDWYCIEVRHFNCFNELSNDESFICWDSQKKDVWVRQPPKFAIRDHPLLRHRKDTYQDFLDRLCLDGITIIGVRVAESLQRLQAQARRAANKYKGKKKLYPIYDWKDKDVWLYLKNENVKIPEIYLYLWQVGMNRRQLRVSQFFSIDTSRSLVQMNEYYPDLMERIIRREPNAYLAALYWDSEMFGRASRKRKEMEKGQAKRDYKAELLIIFNEFDKRFTTPHKRQIAAHYRNFFLEASSIVDNDDCQKIYEGLINGDPKLRTLRALYHHVYGKYVDVAKKGVIRNG